MANIVMPTREEAAELVPGRGSVTWLLAGDARLMLASGYALLLQVCHPTVGAGVQEYSDYESDPWGRLLRTLDFTNVMVYGGPEAAWEMGRRVREMHKVIKGVKPDGDGYHALEPEAYAWVHGTLAEAIVSAHQRFGRPMERSRVGVFYDEWRRMGRLLGVRERDLPETWAGFRAYVDEMVEERLEATEAGRGVIRSLEDPACPPGPIGAGAWRVARIPAVRLSRLGTIGLLPPVLRERLGLRWTRRDELELTVAGRLSRATTPVLPKSLRRMGPNYLDWRRGAIERGDVASPARWSHPSSTARDSRHDGG
jgi:uncharacterized protein (DUF2236 family)